MLKFFRKIRQSLLSEGNTGKYFKYAIGEIVLVVIGILIALQINNWNEERLDRIDEVEAVKGLISDVQLDLHNFEYRLEHVELKKKSLLRLEETLSNKNVDADDKILGDVVIGANFGWNQGQANRATYDGLMSSGRLGVIRASRIRSKIAKYYLAFAESATRIDERETEFPALSYRLVPREDAATDESSVVAETMVLSTLSKPVREASPVRLAASGSSCAFMDTSPDIE